MKKIKDLIYTFKKTWKIVNQDRLIVKQRIKYVIKLFNYIITLKLRIVEYEKKLQPMLCDLVLDGEFKNMVNQLNNAFQFTCYAVIDNDGKLKYEFPYKAKEYHNDGFKSNELRCGIETELLDLSRKCVSIIGRMEDYVSESEYSKANDLYDNDLKKMLREQRRLHGLKFDSILENIEAGKEIC